MRRLRPVNRVDSCLIPAVAYDPAMKTRFLFKTLRFMVLSVPSVVLGAGGAMAQTWTTPAAPSNPWVAVASSADGSRLLAASGGASGPGVICLSTNAGASWSQSPAPLTNWVSVASSADGTRLTAAATGLTSSSPGPLFISSDSGVTWSLVAAPAQPWAAVASSADGSRLFAAAGGSVFVSTNGGLGWSGSALPTGQGDQLTSVACSADGVNLIAATGGLPALGHIYSSADSGAHWSQTGAPAANWVSVACSADGVRRVAASSFFGEFGSIYASTDSGVTWTQTGAPSVNWTSVGGSADGRVFVACSGAYKGTSPVCVSTDGGTTWVTPQTSAISFGAVALSADGGRVAAVSPSGTVCLGQTGVPPLLSFFPAAGGNHLGWIIPSASLLLQENSDLTTTNWNNLTNAPMATNFATLQVQSPLIITNAGTGFYRLQETLP